MIFNMLLTAVVCSVAKFTFFTRTELSKQQIQFNQTDNKEHDDSKCSFIKQFEDKVNTLNFTISEAKIDDKFKNNTICEKCFGKFLKDATIIFKFQKNVSFSSLSSDV